MSPEAIEEALADPLLRAVCTGQVLLFAAASDAPDAASEAASTAALVDEAFLHLTRALDELRRRQIQLELFPGESGALRGARALRAVEDLRRVLDPSDLQTFEEAHLRTLR